MSDPKYAQALLDVAEQDILTLQALLATEVGDGVFGFHVQQAAEKSFKAWLALLGVKFPLTHNLGTLVVLLQEQVDATAFLPLTAYTPFGVQFRYQEAEGGRGRAGGGRTAGSHRLLTSHLVCAHALRTGAAG